MRLENETLNYTLTPDDEEQGARLLKTKRRIGSYFLLLTGLVGCSILFTLTTMQLNSKLLEPNSSNLRRVDYSSLSFNEGPAVSLAQSLHSRENIINYANYGNTNPTKFVAGGEAFSTAGIDRAEKEDPDGCPRGYARWEGSIPGGGISGESIGVRSGVEECANVCTADSRCHSFSHIPEKNQCFIYMGWHPTVTWKYHEDDIFCARNKQSLEQLSSAPVQEEEDQMKSSLGHAERGDTIKAWEEQKEALQEAGHGTGISESGLIPQTIQAAGQNNKDGGGSKKPIIGVLLFTFDRRDYLKRTLDRLLEVRKDHVRFPLTVSQDGRNAEVAALLDEYANSDAGIPNFRVFHHHRRVPPRWSDPLEAGYFHISQHYLWALRKMFEEYDQVIILEDDMIISHDFFEYFDAMLPILKGDKGLMCVSAWNDNGLETLVRDSKALYRTDVFPGLGWMQVKDTFMKLRYRWPAMYWDQFYRRADIRKGRQCIHPEVNRVITFGKIGASGGQYFDKYLAQMKLNEEVFDWNANREAIDRVKSKDNFDVYIESALKGAKLVTLNDIESYDDAHKTLRMVYTHDTYKEISQRFSLFPDMQANMRRTSYRDVVIFRWKTNLVFLTKSWPEL